MTQEEIYKAASELLSEIADLPGDQFLFGEQLFLFRHCLRFPSGQYSVLATFGEKELTFLMQIVRAVLARQGRQVVH